MRSAAARTDPRRIVEREPSVASRRSYIAVPPDRWLFIAVALLVGIGLVMIFSASSATAYAEHRDTAYYLKRQTEWLALGLLCAYIAYRLDYRLLYRLAPAIFILSLLTLAAVLVPHVGIAVNGARRWLGFHALSVQPSEFAKPALIIFLAALLSKKNEKIISLAGGLLPACGAIVAVAVLVLMEPDMGTASLYALFGAVMLFAAGARITHLIAVGAVTIPPAVLAIIASPYRRARILAFIDPWKDPQNTGFHIVQSLYALGSGGFFGVGLGNSRAKFFYLPEQYTDFIFSILGEELGLIGTVSVVALFVLLAYRGIRIAVAAPDRFGCYLATGCTAMIVLQAFVNIGVVTSSWPVTGVPLPFISFGGSSLIVNLVAVALIANVGRQRRVDAA
ncbi:MAG: putative lipid II flippase FtsW [Vulcanimicrobiaceae bacterium]